MITDDGTFNLKKQLSFSILTVVNRNVYPSFSFSIPLSFMNIDYVIVPGTLLVTLTLVPEYLDISNYSLLVLVKNMKASLGA